MGDIYGFPGKEMLDELEEYVVQSSKELINVKNYRQLRDWIERICENSKT